MVVTKFVAVRFTNNYNPTIFVSGAGVSPFQFQVHQECFRVSGRMSACPTVYSPNVAFLKQILVKIYSTSNNVLSWMPLF